MSLDAFPQLADYELPPPLWCAVCPPSKVPFNSPAQIIQHAMISHKLGLPEARALLEDADKPPAAGGLAPIIRKKSDDTPKEKAARKARGKKLAAAAGDINPTQGSLQICNSCGEQIEGKLADHSCS